MSAQFEISVISDASVWRADYEHCREIYGVASRYVSRLRQHLVQACHDARLTSVQRNGLLEIVTQIDDERRGR